VRKWGQTRKRRKHGKAAAREKVIAERCLEHVDFELKIISPIPAFATALLAQFDLNHQFIPVIRLRFDSGKFHRGGVVEPKFVETCREKWFVTRWVKLGDFSPNDF
jgi:hypothetical protein